MPGGFLVEFAANSVATAVGLSVEAGLSCKDIDPFDLGSKSLLGGVFGTGASHLAGILPGYGVATFFESAVLGASTGSGMSYFYDQSMSKFSR